MANKVVICGIDTSSLPRCNNQKLNELMAEIKKGNQLAREEFIIYNMRLVLSVLRGDKHHVRKFGLRQHLLRRSKTHRLGNVKFRRRQTKLFPVDIRNRHDLHLLGTNMLILCIRMIAAST